MLRSEGDDRQQSTMQKSLSRSFMMQFPLPNFPPFLPKPSPPPPREHARACLVAHEHHLKAMREQEARWQAMSEGEWQA